MGFYVIAISQLSLQIPTCTMSRRAILPLDANACPSPSRASIAEKKPEIQTKDFISMFIFYLHAVYGGYSQLTL